MTDDTGTTGGTAGTGQQPGDTAGTAQPGGAAGTGPSMAAMTCDQLIPSTVRDQYLRDAKITSTGEAGGNVANCRAEGGDLTSAVNITADCATTGARTPSDIRRQNPSGRAIENVGKAAVLTETGSTKQLTALDDDSNCRIDVSVPQNVDAVAIGRAMLDKLPGKG